jgi:hypothetical protein
MPSEKVKVKDGLKTPSLPYPYLFQKKWVMVTTINSLHHGEKLSIIYCSL